MLAAILFSGLLLTSCSVDVLDNPVVDSAQPSAVDPGKWTIDDSFVDHSVKPGDDFFMHRIGKWWAATTIDDKALFPKAAGFVDDLVAEIHRQTDDSPKSIQILIAHLAALLDNEQTATIKENGLLYASQVYMDCGYLVSVWAR